MSSNRFAPKALVTACTVAMLSACGGGSGDEPAPAPKPIPPEPTVQSVSGRVIDGYLVGAKVCLDLNLNGICDANEPTAVTDAEGRYSFAYEGDVVGQRLLAQVTPETRDTSREGYRFPATFTLSAFASGREQQHITPLSTMVLAQMEAGLSEAEAVAAVRELLGESIDPSADYIAQSNTAVQLKAGKIVDQLTTLAQNGNADTSSVRNILNAMVTAGDIAAVTQADVDAQATQPVYLPADASQVLATPLYSLVEPVLFGTSAQMSIYTQPTQGIQSIKDGKLETVYQAAANGQAASSQQWQDYPHYRRTSGMEPAAQFVLKADGTWSKMLTAADWRAPLSLETVGRTLTGIDPHSGIKVNYEMRRVDLSNQLGILGISGTLFGISESSYRVFSEFSSTYVRPAVKFPVATDGYLQIQSFAEDYIVLPLGLGDYASDPCAFPYVNNCPAQVVMPVPGVKAELAYYPSGGGVVRSLYAADDARHSAPAYKPDEVFNDPGLVSSPFTSVKQLIGKDIRVPVVWRGTVQVRDDGKAFLYYEDVYTCSRDVSTTWSIHPRNANVMVIEIPKKARVAMKSVGGLPSTLKQEGKLVLAVREGQLHSGLLLPAGYGHRTLQFQEKLPPVLATGYTPGR